MVMSNVENFRFTITVFKMNRKNNLLRASGKFNGCDLKNVKVHLNSEIP